MISLKSICLSCGFIILIGLLVACSKSESNFSQLPGFKQYFAEHEPSGELPTAAEQALLDKYKPRVFLAKGQTPFINFYKDYIAHGALYVNKKLVSKTVTPNLLNKYRDNVTAEFRYSSFNKVSNKQKSTPIVYARIQRDELIHQNQKLPLTFLSYNLVFANSGLVKGLASWQRLAMGLVASNTDWHQLDHYVGLTIVLLDKKPIAVMLQQHNYQTTWLLTDKNTEHTVQLPQDNRIEVDVAMQSNELYLHSPELSKHPGVSFVTKDSIEFLKTRKNKPTMAGWDITHGEIEQDYTLDFLPTADAFYTFIGKLGVSRKLPGRDGPPGANYVTLPPLMPWANRLVSAYRPRSVLIEKEKIKDLINESEFSIMLEGLEAYKRDFLKDLRLYNQSQ